MFLEIKIELVTSNCTPLQWGQQVYFHSGECQQALTVTKELHLAASAISRARNPPVILPLPPAPTAAPPHWGDIDQVSSAEEGRADQELLEEAIKLEPIHLPVFISSRLLQAAGCILSHPVLAALSAKRKPSHLCEIPAPLLAAVLVQIPAAASLLHGLSAVQIRGFSPAAISYLRCQLLTELR